MKWQGRQQSSNIEDRRSQGGGGLGGSFGGGGLGGGGMGPIRIPTGRAGGGIGIIGIVVVLGLIWVLTGQNPLDTITGGDTSSGTFSTPSSSASQDELMQFVGVVVKDTENYWTEVFQKNGKTYPPPKVVVFSQATQSGCGVAQASMGPFYCPNDQKVYLDLAFYDELRQRFGAPGDFAEAYVIAHEVGHHVQNLTGVLPEFNRKRATMSQADQNAYSVRVELQADCYAGLWAYAEGQQGYLDQGDVEEAINAANQIGDDTLSQGTESPREYTHGTSAQRMKWLKRGMTGDISQCDTFSGTP